MSSILKSTLYGTLFASLLMNGNEAATTCADACGTGVTDCIVFNDNVVGCYGTFTGPISGTALDLCNRAVPAEAWNMCESGQYANILGLDANNDCNNGGVPAGDVFWTLESTGANEQWQCFTNSGNILDSRPFNNVWGCAGAGTNIPGTFYNQCGTQGSSLNLMIDAGQNADYTNYGLEFCGGYTIGCDGSEGILLEALDASKYGVLCCASDPVIDLGTCDDSITVVDFYFWPRYQIRGDYNFAPYIGRFTYAGPDSNGYPRYVNWNSPQDSSNNRAEISVIEEPNNAGVFVLSLTIPDYGRYYVESSKGGEAKPVTGEYATYEIGNSIFDASETDTKLAESLIPASYTGYKSAFENDMKLRILFNDCSGGQGLRKVGTPQPTPNPTPNPTPPPTDPTPEPTNRPTPNPTPNPTPAPVDPTPNPTPAPTNGNNNECEDYDHTVYNSCDDDAFCSNCQPWGCAQCATGYYKRGNFKRCQSCNDNYPNCQQCSDWNGCVACNSGYQLQWNGECNDETCQ